MATRETILTTTELDTLYPVGQATQTGKWGWERVNGCLNLKRCVYASKLAATRARNEANRVGNLGSR